MLAFQCVTVHLNLQHKLCVLAYIHMSKAIHTRENMQINDYSSMAHYNIHNSSKLMTVTTFTYTSYNG